MRGSLRLAEGADFSPPVKLDRSHLPRLLELASVVVVLASLIDLYAWL